MEYKSSVGIYYVGHLYQKFVNKLQSLKLQSEDGNTSLYFKIMSLIDQCHTHLVDEESGSAMFYL
jgi:hypothetical protein